ncbi:MAG TPA: TetR/AcrR family transcriptional regulator [Burkholderiaceae bacterium]|nr:TetR/AcrR family transcriptional regulator [Burkholderiaceae bacterium]
MPARPPTSVDTAERILDIASRLVQSRGFNGFSYADIAAELQVTKASLHYHFATKAELGRRLIERYEADFLEALDAIDLESRSAFDRLQRYARLYASVLSESRMCLCGMLAAESGTLPEPMRAGLQHYFDANEHWLARVLDDGRKAGELRFEGRPLAVAAMLVGALEGAMMLARSYGDSARFDSAAQRLLADLKAVPGARTVARAAAKPAAAQRDAAVPSRRAGR